MDIVRSAKLRIDPSERFQRIDGFGVNINSKYWDNGRLRPVVDLLVDDLGATLFRLDHYGRANWMDPDGTQGASVLNRAAYDACYRTADFQNALGMAKHLNGRGIEPYITVSGIVPPWMCGEDGKTLGEFEQFADMVVDYAYWLRKEGVAFTLFGPLNETDIGPPEGPFVNPAAYVAACEAIVERLDSCGMGDVKLVVAEQAQYSLDYARALLQSSRLQGRIGVLGMHAYTDFHVDDLLALAAERDPAVRCWMTEYGDLDQSDEREHAIAWASAQRLLRLLEDGMQGALSWDAFDNYHDHDDTWTTFGLIKNAWDVYIPKKRYYALKHVYRYVRPGFRRIAVSCTNPEIAVLAFVDDASGALTVVGMNPRPEGVHVDLDLGYNRGGEGMRYRDFEIYRTAEYEDCARVTTPVIKVENHATKGAELIALPHSIFTITNLK